MGAARRRAGANRDRRLPPLARRASRPSFHRVPRAVAVVGRRPRRASGSRCTDWCETQWSTRPDRVLASRELPGARWFTGGTLNYARARAPGDPPPRRRDRGGRAQPDPRAPVALSWGELADAVARCRSGLQRRGVRAGDRVVAFAPNIPETLVAFLATASLGAVWSSCAPEFGTKSVVDRFAQIEPTVLLAVDGYRYGDKDIDRVGEVAAIEAALPTLRHTVRDPLPRHRRRRLDRLARRARRPRVRRGAVRPPALRAVQLRHHRVAEGDRARARRHHPRAPEDPPRCTTTSAAVIASSGSPRPAG